MVPSGSAVSSKLKTRRQAMLVPHDRLQVSGSCHKTAVSLLAVLTLYIATASASLAQSQTDLDSFAHCSTCALRAVSVARLGTADGDGAIQGDFVQLSYDARSEEFLMYVVNGTRLQIFARDGSFLRAFGTRGDGPGELQAVRHAEYRDGRILVLDSRRRRLITFSSQGAVVSEGPVTVLPGVFAQFSDDRVVLAAVSRTADAVGYPLHLMRASNGQLLRHFGSPSGEYNAARAEPYSNNVKVSAAQGDASVWLWRPNRLRLEEWRLDGTAGRLVSGEPGWLMPVLKAPMFGDEPPATLLTDVIETNGFLWTTAITADLRWREAVGRAAGGEPEPGVYMDLRVDAWDLGRRLHLGPLISDNPGAFALRVGNDFWFYRMEFDTTLVPKLAVYRVEVSSNSDERRVRGSLSTSPPRLSFSS
jgi:hypothetical protein